MALHRAGKPMQNGYVDSFNGRMRDELLNETLFLSIAHAPASRSPPRWTTIAGRDHTRLWIRDITRKTTTRLQS